MKILILFTLIFNSLVSLGQSKTPFDALVVGNSELIENVSEITAKQQEAIQLLDERTKSYVIKVFAEEKPNSAMFKGRMEDIKKHRDYKLKQILNAEQYTDFLKNMASVNADDASKNSL